MHPGLLFAAALATSLHLLPRPQSVEGLGCSASTIPHEVAGSFDGAARTEIDERWSALGIGRLRSGNAATIVVRRDATLSPQAYRLTVAGGRATIESADAAGAFYGAVTLAQLPQRSNGTWTMPCVRIADKPALRWRILSDDVSRGPLPTMRYFEERIRTIAAFKMNGYSPYMEHVFLSPTDPLPAPLDGITPSQLHELSLYARRFHVALIVEQQSFAHMHNTLRVERYADAAEFPHGFLLAPNSPLSMEYVSRLVSQELAAVGSTPFFHVGSDETATLGLGRTQDYVAKRGRSNVYAQHLVEMNRLIAPSGARMMVWDDGIENDPEIMKLIPRTAVIVNWHYGAQATFEPFIQTIARGGFEQMVAPGASNWNEIFPAIGTALANERLFINQGKAASVLGLFQTVWHDDGETLYEATWYPVVYAAAAAWEPGDLTPEQFADAFPHAFFGVDDPSYGNDVNELSAALARARTEPSNVRPVERTLLGRSVRSGCGEAGWQRRPAARAAWRGGRPRASLLQSPALARECRVRDVSGRSPLRRPRAEVPDRAPRSEPCTPMPSHTRKPIAIRRCAICSGASIGCGSCATLTSRWSRSTRVPGDTRAAKATSRVIWSAITSPRKKRSIAPMPSTG